MSELNVAMAGKSVFGPMSETIGSGPLSNELLAQA